MRGRWSYSDLRLSSRCPGGRGPTVSGTESPCRPTKRSVDSDCERNVFDTSCRVCHQIQSSLKCQKMLFCSLKKDVNVRTQEKRPSRCAKPEKLHPHGWVHCVCCELHFRAVHLIEI